MSRSIGLAHIVRQDDGTSMGSWGAFTLKSAFQPIFVFVRGKVRIIAFEGLIRPFRGSETLSPGAFFALLPPVDRLHVETLSRTLHLLNAGAFLDPDTSIFVNFDPSLFVERSVVEAALRDMRLVLHEAGIDPRRVVCEVTEQKSGSAAALDAFVHALRMHGFRIAVDDYGAHDSDAERVRALKPDIVKFDAQWITRLMESGPGFALLQAMVSTFAEQGIETVFEGIEESWQLELAERSGAAMVQGYALARPELAPTSFAQFRERQGGDMAAIGSAQEPRAGEGTRKPRVRIFGRRAARS
ncbi:EAL domain-containing protein [Mesorhizobium sp. BAC0120]|uniref:EAL domain-containing protein n=1 Tax=Mesorhizobium sp. BAC0120 TaxID=3090670 RepID=UPI00298BE86A|nr:EAL domain-containing protein [Mesorhizobium sp. BAC0120]MDW6022382.1 EAL domain-containing protein [Mesorhizobium sp. BAC0120]